MLNVFTIICLLSYVGCSINKAIQAKKIYKKNPIAFNPEGGIDICAKFHGNPTGTFWYITLDERKRVGTLVDTLLSAS